MAAGVSWRYLLSMSRTLTLICPALAWPLADAIALQAQPDEAGRLLCLLASRGEACELALDRRLPAAQMAMLETLGLSEQAASYGGAAVMRAATAELPVEGFWMRLEPVHLVAGLDRISVTALPPQARMSVQERDELQPLINEYLGTAGLALHAAAGQWLVNSERHLEVRCLTPEYAASEPNAQVLPAGDDAAVLRRLLTELQMLLHDHPVNERRQRRGLPQINSLWLHGEGALSGMAEQQLIPAFGDDDFLRGICRLHGMSVQPVTDALALLSQLQGDAVAVLDVATLQSLEESWLTAAVGALRRGRITALQLVLGRWQVRVGRADMFKFWRRAQAPAQWAVAN